MSAEESSFHFQEQLAREKALVKAITLLADDYPPKAASLAIAAKYGLPLKEAQAIVKEAQVMLGKAVEVAEVQAEKQETYNRVYGGVMLVLGCSGVMACSVGSNRWELERWMIIGILTVAIPLAISGLFQLIDGSDQIGTD